VGRGQIRLERHLEDWQEISTPALAKVGKTFSRLRFTAHEGEDSYEHSS